ncbi:MAG: DUF389 domain-containing protein [Pseudomonadota bacterium]
MSHGEDPTPVADLAKNMMTSASPTLSFFVMLGLATAIATLGLLSNSAPVVIGAMIVAPLMQPIIGLSFGIVVVDWRLMVHAALTIVSGVVLVIGLAFATTELIGLRVAGSEIVSRTVPSLLDLGIACASGAAGAFVHTRKSIANSIAGVAIAVALVPPLCVVGIGFVLDRHAATEVGLGLSHIGLQAGGAAVAQGAFTLFATNLIGIVVFAGLVFVLHRYGEWKKALLGLVVLGSAAAFIFQPLSEALQRIYVRVVTVRLMTMLVAREHELFTGRSRIQDIRVDYRDETVKVQIDLLSPRDNIEEFQDRIDVLQAHLAESLDEKVDINARVVVVDVVNFGSTPAMNEALDQEVIDEVKE